MKHIHAELMALYAQDAMETDKPWVRWEGRKNGYDEWRPFESGHPSWLIDFEYRRKPRTININGHEVPEPVREKLGDDQTYYTVALTSPSSIIGYDWNGDGIDLMLLKSGLIHLTREAAVAHAEALLSFTKKQ